MSGNRTRKLDAEELENRVAPIGVVLVPSDPDPGQLPGGDGANTTDRRESGGRKNQPKSDTHLRRNKKL